MTRPPSWLEVLGAITLIEAWLRAQLAWLKERWTGDPAVLERLEALLDAKVQTLEALRAIVGEVQVLLAGAGPVDHDPVDFAYDPGVDEPDSPPGA